jgi:hypothetical protein
MKGKGKKRKTESRRIDCKAAHSLGTEEIFFFKQIVSCNVKRKFNEAFIFGVNEGGFTQ